VISHRQNRLLTLGRLPKAQEIAPNDGPQQYRRPLLDIIDQEQLSLLVPISEESMPVALLAPDLSRGTRLLASDATL